MQAVGIGADATGVQRLLIAAITRSLRMPRCLRMCMCAGARRSVMGPPLYPLSRVGSAVQRSLAWRLAQGASSRSAGVADGGLRVRVRSPE